MSQVATAQLLIRAVNSMRRQRQLIDEMRAALCDLKRWHDSMGGFDVRAWRQALEVYNKALEEANRR